MIKNRFKVLLFLVFLTGFSEHALALRCGNKLVSKGDRKPKVIARCGEPDFAETQERWYPHNCAGRNHDRNSYYYNDYGSSFRNSRGTYGYPVCHLEIIDIWTYNFGPRKFIRELIFQDGFLRKINKLEYGY